MNSPKHATIVVGVDGSTSALHAALWAADEAAQRHHRLRLVYANNEFGFGSAGGLAPTASGESWWAPPLSRSSRTETVRSR